MKHYGIIFGIGILIVGIGSWCYYHQQSTRTVATADSPQAHSAKNSEISLSPLTICKALDTAIEYLKLSPEQIHPVNADQQAFLSADYATYRQSLTNDMFATNELKAYVSDNAATLNKILRDNGFSIQLQEFANAQSIGIVAIQNIIVKWIEKAEQKSIQSGKQKYPGFSLDEHKMNVSFYTSSAHNEHQTDPHIVIAEIPTQSSDKVYCAVKVTTNNNGTIVIPFFDEKDTISDHNTMHTINALQQPLHDMQYEKIERYNAIQIPMITYQEQPSLEWLLKLQLHGHEVAQALQEVIFKMNDIGAQAKAAVAIELMKSMAPSLKKPVKEPLIVNQPFLLWIERPGMPLPIFAAYLQYKYWSNPGSLED